MKTEIRISTFIEPHFTIIIVWHENTKYRTWLVLHKEQSQQLTFIVLTCTSHRWVPRHNSQISVGFVQTPQDLIHFYPVWSFFDESVLRWTCSRTSQQNLLAHGEQSKRTYIREMTNKKLLGNFSTSTHSFYFRQAQDISWCFSWVIIF